ncbi:MAG TPA: hypothetical protein VHL58_12475 [Thermoanaerobaculia bacterium]|nr:hypothetical protein [Thermoanaerobaculia bacterium]
MRPQSHPLRLGIWVTLLVVASAVLALQQVLIGSQLNPDGTSYMDLADAYLRLDWRAAVGAYWSPLYPALIAAWFSIIRPSNLQELTAIHGLNCLLFLGVDLLFLYLAQALGKRDSPSGHTLLLTLAAGAAVWSGVGAIGVTLVSPDLLVSGLVVAIAILLLSVSDRTLTNRGAAVFGAVLGMAYLTKFSLLPVACASLFMAFLTARSDRPTLLKLCRTLMIFALIAGVWTGLMSFRVRRLTMGDVGKLSYAWYVGGIRPFAHWMGEPAESGRPAHALELISSEPQLFFFGDTYPHSTYPLWYDASHWYEGLRISFDVSRQMSATCAAIVSFFIAIGDLAPLFAVVLVLILFAGADPEGLAGRWRRVWPLAGMAVFGIAMYLLVHVESRFIGGFVALFVIALVWWVLESPRLLFVSSCVLLSTVCFLVPAAMRMHGDWRKIRVDGIEDPAVVAETIASLGVPPEARIAHFNDSFPSLGWARLAHLHIVADMPAGDFERFLLLPKERQLQLLRELRARKVDFVFAHLGRRHMELAAPKFRATGGLRWQLVDSSGLAMLALRTDRAGLGRRSAI